MNTGSDIEGEKGRYWYLLQPVLVAVITAVLTGYVSGRVVEAKVEFIINRMDTKDKMDLDLRSKVDDIALKQARVIGQADAIHEQTDRRINKLEATSHVDRAR